MDNRFDSFAEAVASNMPRRYVLKSVLGVAAGAISSGLLGRFVLSAQDPHHGGSDTSTRAVTLMFALPSGHTPLIHLRDRLPGRMSYRGEHLTFIPHLRESSGQVELSVYRGPAGTATFAKRVSVPLNERRNATTKVVPLGLAFVPALTVAALRHDDAPMPAVTPQDTSDCSVYCCWGGQMSGCAACCDRSDPSCGSRCDAGCCPACEPIE